MSRATDLMGVGMPGEQAYRIGYASNNITAAGTTSADATALPVANTFAIIAGGGANSGIKLPSTAELLRKFIIVNPTANAILLYPPTSGTINGGTATTGTVTIPANGYIEVMRYSATGWAASAPAAISGNTGTFSGNVTIGGTLGVTVMPKWPSATVAAAGNAQGNAAAITTGFTLVTAADGTKGVVLPTAAAGLVAIVKNADAANAILKIYPATGDGINAVAVNSSLDIAAKTSVLLVAYDATTWYSLPLLPS
jgi:hypothetical protein